MSQTGTGPHTETAVFKHQYCIAHIIRNLICLDEKEKDPWSQDMINLLCNAVNLKAKEKLPVPGSPELKEIEKDFQKLLDRPLDCEHSKKTVKFQLMLREKKDSILLFLYHEKLPPDNNASERAIRNIKVKQKVSGQFIAGHNEFAVLRSLVDTL